MSLARLALTVFAAMSLIVAGDTAGKLLTEGGVAPAFVAWSRFALAALVLVPLIGPRRRGDWRILADRRVLLRGALIAAGIACILTALRTAPIADVFGAFFVGPLVAAAVSVPLLGERMGPARAGLLLAGFAGVLMVVRPGFGPAGFAVAPGIGWALAAGTFYGLYLVATRALAGVWRPGLLLASQLMVGTVLLAPGGLGALPGGLDARFAALVGVSALASAAGNYLLVRASRVADAGRIAPLVYTQLIAATLAGALVFGTLPDVLALAGLGVILVSGLAGLRLRR